MSNGEIITFQKLETWISETPTLWDFKTPGKTPWDLVLSSTNPFTIDQLYPDSLRHEPRINIRINPTQFPEIIQLDPTMNHYEIQTIALSLADLLTPQRKPVTIRIGSAAHLFLLREEAYGLSALVGICGAGKLMEGCIVPLGEKINTFDGSIGIAIDQPTDKWNYHFFWVWRSTCIGAIFRGIREELLPTIEVMNIIRGLLKTKTVLDYAFFDGRYFYINFPVIMKISDEFIPFFNPKDSPEWHGPLRWVPVESLREEQYQGYPIPNGVRFVANQLVKRYTEP